MSELEWAILGYDKREKCEFIDQQPDSRADAEERIKRWYSDPRGNRDVRVVCRNVGEWTDPTTPTPPATEGQAGSGELIPGRDFCPLDGEPLKMVIQAKGKPTLYIHADGFTWHPDASEQIKIRPVADILSQLRSGSPQHLTRPELPEHYAQPSAPAARTDGAALDEKRDAILAQLEKLEAETVSAPVEPEVWWHPEQGFVSIREGTPVLWLDDLDGVGGGAVRVVPPPDVATVLASLRAEMTALADEWGRTLKLDHAASTMDHAIALVEAAQARLADPVLGGGSDG